MPRPLPPDNLGPTASGYTPSSAGSSASTDANDKTPDHLAQYHGHNGADQWEFMQSRRHPRPLAGSPHAARSIQLVNSLLSGQLEVAQGMAAVDKVDSWPIRTKGAYIFATPAMGRSRLFLRLLGNEGRKVEMERRGDVFVLQLPETDITALAYRFEDENGESKADPWARRYQYDSHGNEYSLINSAGAHLERIRSVKDGAHAPRTLRIWVPKHPPKRHLYVQDGQNLFDPKSMWGGWKLQKNIGPDTLVVGIDNTPHRLHEYTPVPDQKKGEPIGGGGDAYANFLHHTIRPMVEARYGESNLVGLMGSSLGGLISLHIARQFPDHYHFVASLSGTLGWGKMQEGKAPTLAETYPQNPPPMVHYIDSGGAPGQGDNYDVNRQFANKLAARGMVWNQNLFHWHQLDAPHRETAWAERVWRPLRIFDGMKPGP